MHTELSFHTLDVFTERTFGGNPLCVFPDATHLPTNLMQRIAREMNLSETVFLGAPETMEGTARVRIFTPNVEVPFAGHPTVGAAIFIADQQLAEEAVLDGAEEEVSIILEVNVGLVPVDVQIKAGQPVFGCFTTAILPEHRPSPYSCDQLARMISLSPEDVCPEGFYPEMVSCGLAYHVIPVRTIEAMSKASLDMALWNQMLADTWAHHVYLVCMQAEGGAADIRVRMFAPGSGVPEDPATGSAAAALGGYLSKMDAGNDNSLSWTIEQGIEMGRPSLIYLETVRAGGSTSAVRVGGKAVRVSSGTMRIPPFE